MGSFGGFRGGGRYYATEAESAKYSADQPQAASDNSGLIIGVAVGAAILVVVVVVVLVAISSRQSTANQAPTEERV